MHRNFIIPASHILRRLSDTAAFRGSGGSSRSINEVLKRMLDADELRQVPKTQMVEMFGTGARAFAISRPELVLGEF